MKILMIPIAAILLILGCTSSPRKDVAADKEISVKESKSIVYAGLYSYGLGADKGPSGNITVFPKNDSTLLFAIDLSVGPPSYNMGALFDTLKVKDNRAIYAKKMDDGDTGCKWQVDFYGDSLTIKTLDNAYDCGFGGNVFADGTYKVVNHDVPAFYTTLIGDTVYFDK